MLPKARVAHAHERQAVSQGEDYAKFNRLVDVEEKIIGGNSYHPKAMLQRAFVHRVKGKQGEAKGRPCMLYFHGGGGILGSADASKQICNRYAVEGNCTVVNVDYRLAPECKAPAGTCDAYAALKYVYDEARGMGIDKTRIGMFGDGGGAYICAAVGHMLAQRDEGVLVKF